MSLPLQISGQPQRKVNYTRVPHVDALGLKYSAFVHTNRVHYRPLGGDLDNRILRAQYLADQFQGELKFRDMKDGYTVVFVVVPLTTS